MRCRVAYISALVMLLIAAKRPARAWASDPAPLERRVQAALVFNFIQFTEWTKGTFEKADDPILVGVIGSPAMLDAVQTLVAGKSVNGHGILVRALHSADDAGGCHVVIVAGKVDGFDQFIGQLESKPILTIGDFEGFTDAGGVIRFYVEDGKERFEIN